MEAERAPANLHATGLVAAGAGVIISGGSGSGKSSLAFELVERGRQSGRFSRLVSDDQIFLNSAGGRLIMRAPTPIAGLAEIRGYGVAAVDHEPASVVDLMVELVPPEEAPRHRRDKIRDLHGVAISCLELPERDSAGSARAILAWLAGRLVESEA
ncbi:MAG: HPr kinase/phosphorylase [Rhizobiaceae bacterium]